MVGDLDTFSLMMIQARLKTPLNVLISISLTGSNNHEQISSASIQSVTVIRAKGYGNSH
jgi:hypothetical protein